MAGHEMRSPEAGTVAEPHHHHGDGEGSSVFTQPAIAAAACCGPTVLVAPPCCGQDDGVLAVSVAATKLTLDHPPALAPRLVDLASPVGIERAVATFRSFARASRPPSLQTPLRV